LTDKGKKGDCFKANAEKILNNCFFNKHKFFENALLCHGYVSGAKGSLAENQVFVHAWIEKDDLFLDFSNGIQIILRKNHFYEKKRIYSKSVIRYTPEQVAQNILKHKHYGFWDDFFKNEIMTLEEAKEFL